jgi:hypothetical protein
MSGSAIRLTEKPKINSSRNMHITGKEKTPAAKAVHEVPTVGGAASDVAVAVCAKGSLSTRLFL